MMSVTKGGVQKGKDVHKALMPGTGCTKSAQQDCEWHCVWGSCEPRESRQDSESRKEEIGMCSHCSLNLWELI